jgi:hypothetical protein
MKYASIASEACYHPQLAKACERESDSTRRDRDFPEMEGGLNGSAQHLLEVYRRAF